MKKAAGKSSHDATPTCKRPRIAATGKPHLLKRYPINIMSCEQMSPEALQETELTLKEQEEKTNPDPHIYLPLMKATFDFHRQYIVTEAESAVDIMEKYSYLKLKEVVSIIICIHDVLYIEYITVYSLIRNWS